MIIINKILKSYKNFNLSIENITINKGQIIGLVGQNGSGKTTLVEGIIGIREMDYFDATIDKKTIFNAVFQESSFDNNFKVIEIINMYLSIYNLKNKNINKILKIYGLYEIKTKKFRTLSSGQKQKLKIAIAFLNTPNVIALDEVSTSLDIIWQKQILKIIKEFINNNPDSIIIMASHNLNDIVNICDKVILLVDGKIDSFKNIDKNNKHKILNELERIIYE